jgi:NSS family neurotransmitter:Na+ symporter
MSEQFSSRWGIILASLGMAIGAGNIWRFPRIAGEFGGTFIILWLFFLVVWSIPILLAEFSIGKKFKKSVIGSFAGVVGERYTWMGFFIAVCTLGIAFYYSVVIAWALRYLGFSVQQFSSSEPLSVTIQSNPSYLADFWAHVTTANTLTIILHVVAVIIGIVFLIRGVQKGLELANKILIPTLFILLLITSFIALNLDGAIKGLDYMFRIDLALFSNPEVWLQALSQSAWSTGAGWGLIMTISSYSRSKEDVTLNTLIGGFGNNTASLIAGITILPAVFGLAATEQEALTHLQAGNQGLTFTVIPLLFSQISGGQVLSIIFFLALFIAALSSLLPMIELFIRILTDLGYARKSATLKAGLFCVIFGLPSAYSLEFFNNQDWVWGIGLVLSGLFIIFAVFKTGIEKFKREYIDQDSDLKLPLWFFKSAMILNVFLGIFIMISWMTKGYSSDNYNIFDTYSNATVLFQWVVVLVTGLLLNRVLYKKFGKT